MPSRRNKRPSKKGDRRWEGRKQKILKARISKFCLLRMLELWKLIICISSRSLRGEVLDPINGVLGSFGSLQTDGDGKNCTTNRFKRQNSISKSVNELRQLPHMIKQPYSFQCFRSCDLQISHKILLIIL